MFVDIELSIHFDFTVLYVGASLVLFCFQLLRLSQGSEKTVNTGVTGPVTLMDSLDGLDLVCPIHPCL